MINAIEVAFESFLDFILGLANILFLASFAAYAINEVVAVAGDVQFGRVSFASDIPGNVTRFVQFGTISAFHFCYAPSIVLAGPQSAGISWLIWDLGMD